MVTVSSHKTRKSIYQSLWLIEVRLIPFYLQIALQAYLKNEN